MNQCEDEGCDHYGKMHYCIDKNIKESVNKFLTEKFLNLRDYQREMSFSEKYQIAYCSQDLFTDKGFFILWKKTFKKNEEGDYLNEAAGKILRKLGNASFDKIPVNIINEITFPVILAELLGWKE